MPNTDIEELRSQLKEYTYPYTTQGIILTDDHVEYLVEIIQQKVIEARIDESKYYAQNINKHVGSPMNNDMPENYVPGIVENMVDDRVAELQAQLNHNKKGTQTNEQ